MTTENRPDVPEPDLQAQDTDDQAGHDHEGHDHDHGHDHEGHDHDHHDHDDPAVAHEADVERSGARITMTITVAADEITENFDAVAGMFRQRAKLQGFRRGKAPMSMIRLRFADEIKENVLEELIPRHVGSEIKARELKPIHNPMLDTVDFQPGQDLTIKVQFDVEPEVDVTGYKGLSATKVVRTVADDAVEKAITNMREQAAKLESVEDGAIELGDYAIVKIALFPRDGKGKKLDDDERFVHVGEEQSIPALNTQLDGQSKGSKREFVTELGESYPNELLAGKEVMCHVEVEEIKRRILPAIDDDLARDLGHADLEELRTKTREGYARHVDEEADVDVVRQLMDHVMGATHVDAPESLIESKLDHSVQRAAEDLARRGVDPQNAVDWVNFRADNRPHAERAVKEEILLDAIAEAENIEVGDTAVQEEIESHQEGQPEGTGTRIATQMRQDGSFEGLRRAMLRRRALDFVKGHATIDIEEASPESATD